MSNSDPTLSVDGFGSVDVLRDALTLVRPFPFVAPEPSMETNPSRLRDTCRQLSDEIGAEWVAELLESFLTDTPARLKEIGSLIASGDQVALRRAAHSLKGSSSIFGLSGIEEISNRLEHGPVDSSPADQAQLLDLLRSEFLSARGQLVALAKEFAEQS
jgi:HPt (histidine-containing phosphotransfer) domain-containing protein